MFQKFHNDVQETTAGSIYPTPITHNLIPYHFYLWGVRVGGGYINDQRLRTPTLPQDLNS